jgi:hypothetical protein
MRSLPPKPLIVSLPDVPVRLSFPLVPLIVAIAISGCQITGLGRRSGRGELVGAASRSVTMLLMMMRG